MNSFPFALNNAQIDNSLWEKIQTLNLELIVDRMIIKHGWTEDKTEKALKDYRYFLYMSQMVEQAITPTGDVDDLWHEHILHTNKYAIDCQKLFGKFLHHFPTPAKWTINEPANSLDASCDGPGTSNCGVNDCTSDCSPRMPDYDNPTALQNKESIQFSELKIKYNLS